MINFPGSVGEASKFPGVRWLILKQRAVSPTADACTKTRQPFGVGGEICGIGSRDRSENKTVQQLPDLFTTFNCTALWSHGAE